MFDLIVVSKSRCIGAATIVGTAGDATTACESCGRGLLQSRRGSRPRSWRPMAAVGSGGLRAQGTPGRRRLSRAAGRRPRSGTSPLCPTNTATAGPVPTWGRRSRHAAANWCGRDCNAFEDKRLPATPVGRPVRGVRPARCTQGRATSHGRDRGEMLRRTKPPAEEGGANVSSSF